jgi:hypothetical protein
VIIRLHGDQSEVFLAQEFTQIHDQILLESEGRNTNILISIQNLFSRRFFRSHYLFRPNDGPAQRLNSYPKLPEHFLCFCWIHGSYRAADQRCLRFHGSIWTDWLPVLFIAFIAICKMTSLLSLCSLS